MQVQMDKLGRGHGRQRFGPHPGLSRVDCSPPPTRPTTGRVPRCAPARKHAQGLTWGGEVCAANWPIPRAAFVITPALQESRSRNQSM